jgi:molecular chaperone GrpE
VSTKPSDVKEEQAGYAAQDTPSDEPIVVTPEAKPEPAAEPTIDELKQAVQKAEEALADKHNEMLRAYAELENARKRAERDVDNARKFALERFVSELLPFKDSLDLGVAAAANASEVASLKEGMQLSAQMFSGVLEKFGVQVIDPVSEKFNPEWHQAISMQESADAEPNSVLHVVQRGYRLHERLVRPAMVVVAKAPAAAPETPSSES